MKMDIEITKKGLPAIWEEGKSNGTISYSRIICDSQGRKKKPAFINIKSGEKHGLFILKKGDFLIQTTRVNGNFEVEIFRYTGTFIRKTKEGYFYLSNKKTNGKWDKKLLPQLEKPVEASISKIKAGSSDLYYAI